MCVCVCVCVCTFVLHRSMREGTQGWCIIYARTHVGVDKTHKEKEEDDCLRYLFVRRSASVKGGGCACWPSLCVVRVCA